MLYIDESKANNTNTSLWVSGMTQLKNNQIFHPQSGRSDNCATTAVHNVADKYILINKGYHINWYFFIINKAISKSTYMYWQIFNALLQMNSLHVLFCKLIFE